MLTLWKTLVLPRLEYCSQLWDPFHVGEIQQLEIVQRSFIRKIDGALGLSIILGTTKKVPVVLITALKGTI